MPSNGQPVAKPVVVRLLHAMHNLETLSADLSLINLLCFVAKSISAKLGLLFSNH